MSNFILEYLNNEIKLSNIINNIETDFSAGYYFAELLQKLGCLKTDIKNFKKEPRTEEEIRNNFNKIKPEFRNIGIHLDEDLINSMINCDKNIAANLIYKIKTKITRKNINFDRIMKKIKMSEQKYEEVKKSNTKFMKNTMNFFRRQSQIMIKTKSSSNFSEISGLTNYQLPIKYNLKASSSVPYLRHNNNNNNKLKLNPLDKIKNKKLNLPLTNKEENKNHFKTKLYMKSMKSKNIKEIIKEFSHKTNDINMNKTKKTRNKKINNFENDSSLKIITNQMNNLKILKKIHI